MNSITATLLTAALGAAPAQAGFTGWHAEATYSAIGGQGTCVVDLYAEFDSTSFVLLYAFFADLELSGADFATLIQNDLGSANWNPNLSTPPVDSYVRIGGPVGTIGGSFTIPDPNWGVPGFVQPAVPSGAGWYNSNPPSVQGQATSHPWGIGTPVLSFAVPGGALPVTLTFSATVIYNTGPGMPALQGEAIIEFQLVLPFPDCNVNGVADAVEIEQGALEDCDGDAVPDACQGGIVDGDGDGVSDCDDACPTDPAKSQPGACGCGVAESDGDGDGVPDCIDGCPGDATKSVPGPCGCGISDVDADGDGTPNCFDGCPADPAKSAPGACGCGVPDLDQDNDGVLDCDDLCPGFDDGADSDGDGIPDGCEPVPCPADLDGDRTVGGGDLGQLLGQWGACVGCSADFDGDGVVSGGDLGQLLGAWGGCG